MDLETRLREALRSAMSSRDTPAVSALRSALGALGNAAAVPVGVGDGSSTTTSPHIAGAIAGLAGTEAPRRELTPVEQRALVWDEISDRRAAAERMAQLGRADDGERLLAEADALEGALNLE